MKKKYLTREDWMVAAVELMAGLFEKVGYKVPKVRVSCGWPSSGGLGQKRKTLGQHWAPEASVDNRSQIFISPWLENKGECGVLPVLAHEVVHAVVGNDAKHGKVFRKCAEAIGLTGKMTSTVAGAELMEKISKWQTVLGEYPHGKLDPKKSPVKKQTTRMIKMECPECGYVARTSRKWLEEVGAAHCPAHGEMTVEKTDGDEDDED